MKRTLDLAGVEPAADGGFPVIAMEVAFCDWKAMAMGQGDQLLIAVAGSRFKPQSLVMFDGSEEILEGLSAHRFTNPLLRASPRSWPPR